MKQLFRKIENWQLKRKVRKSVQKNPNFVEEYFNNIPENTVR